MSIALLILSILANTLPRWWFAIYGSTEGSFMKWQAFSFLLMAIAGRLTKGTKKESIWWEYVFLLTVNNWIDEIREHAEEIDGVEVVFTIAVTLWLLYRLIKCQTKTNS